MTVVIATDFALTWRYRAAYDAYDLVLAKHESVQRDPAAHADFNSLLRSYAELQDAVRAIHETFDAASMTRAYLSVTLLLAYLALARGDRTSLGLLPAPVQGWRYWLRMGTAVCLYTLAAALPLLIICLSLGWPIHTNWDGKSDFNESLVEAVIRAPIYEEMIYRVGICVPVCAALGNRAAIAIGGLLFSLIHVVAGNPNPLNLIAGFFFVWIFLKSGTVLVPMLIHFIGNAFFLYAQLLLVTIASARSP